MECKSEIKENIQSCFKAAQKIKEVVEQNLQGKNLEVSKIVCDFICQKGVAFFIQVQSFQYEEKAKIQLPSPEHHIMTGSIPD